MRLVILLHDGDIVRAARIGASMGLPATLVPAVTAARQGSGGVSDARNEIALLYGPDRPDGAVVGALLHALAGDGAGALDALEIAYAARLPSLPLIVRLPVFAEVRKDPRFGAVVRGMGL